MGSELTGEVALVTGGGRGIGRAVAQGLASAGATVGIVARNRPELDSTVQMIRDAGGTACAVVTDVRDPGSVQRAVDEVTGQLGPVSMLVNNAGAPGPTGNDWEVNPEDWWECIESIVRGAFLFNAAVLPSMIERGQGRIIHVASASGTRAPGIPIFASSIAKTALIRLAEEVAQTAKPFNVSAFAIHPGVVNTKLLSSYGLTIPESMFSPPEKAAALCVALASGRYDSLSGRYLTVDDDLDGLLGRIDEITKGELYTLRIKA